MRIELRRKFFAVVQDDRIGKGLGLRSNDADLKHVGLLLARQASDSTLLQPDFVVVSTGSVRKAKLQQYAIRCGRFIALIRSSSIADGGPVCLEPGGREKRPERDP